MGLIEKWQNAVNASRRMSGMRAGAYETCITDLTDATTPRPPKAEWFGTGPGQWDSWWVKESLVNGQKGSSGVWVSVRVDGLFIGHDGFVPSWMIEDIECCVPVAREGFPCPVGWDVVGG